MNTKNVMRSVFNIEVLHQTLTLIFMLIGYVKILIKGYSLRMDFGQSIDLFNYFYKSLDATVLIVITLVILYYWLRCVIPTFIKSLHDVNIWLLLVAIIARPYWVYIGLISILYVYREWLIRRFGSPFRVKHMIYFISIVLLFGLRFVLKYYSFEFKHLMVEYTLKLVHVHTFLNFLPVLVIMLIAMNQRRKMVKNSV